MTERPPKVLVAYDHRAVCPGVYFRAGMSLAGAHVMSVGPVNQDIYGGRFHPADLQMPNFAIPREVACNPEGLAIQPLLDAIKLQTNQQFDLVLMVDQRDAFYLTGQVLGGHPKFAWVNVENWDALAAQRATRRETDAEFYMIAHLGDGLLPPFAPKARYLPFGADPSSHRYTTRITDRPLRLCHIGTPYPPRPNIWHELRAHFGKQTDLSADFSEYAAGTVICEAGVFGRSWTHEGMTAAYNMCRYALSMSNVDFVPMRVPEALAYGCILISDNQPSIRALLGRPIEEDPDWGVWIEHKGTVESMIAAVELLDSLGSHQLEAISSRAVATCYRKHLYMHRCLDILNAAGLATPHRLVA